MQALNKSKTTLKNYFIWYDTIWYKHLINNAKLNIIKSFVYFFLSVKLILKFISLKNFSQG